MKSEQGPNKVRISSVIFNKLALLKLLVVDTLKRGSLVVYFVWRLRLLCVNRIVTQGHLKK